MTDRLLDANEVAERLHVPVSWVRESTRSGAMPCVELGRYRRYEWPAVEAWLEACKQPGRTITLRGKAARLMFGSDAAWVQPDPQAER